MRSTFPDIVERSRVQLMNYPKTKRGEHNGAFEIRSEGNIFFCVISNGGGWDHVSIFILGKSRCPTWEEMSWFKELFFADDETVVQFHPPKEDHINIHPYCLDLWRCHKHFPRPNKIMVGPKL